MTWQPSSDQLVENWIAEGPNQMPDRVVHNVLSQVDQTNQRGHLWPPGSKHMSRTFLAVGGIAAALMLLVTSGAYFGWLPNLAVGDAPSATQSPSPSATPTLGPLPTGGGALDVGQHYVDVGGYRYTFVVPEPGWASYPLHDDWSSEIVYDYSAVEVVLWGSIDSSAQVYSDACQWSGTETTPGPSALDFANTLTGLSGFTTTSPTPVRIGDRWGQQLQMTVPAGIDARTCGLGQYRSWDSRYFYRSGQTDDLRIVDLDGGDRHIYFGTYFTETTDSIKAQVAQLLQSITIAPAP